MIAVQGASAIGARGDRRLEGDWPGLPGTARARGSLELAGL
jgi:hypothetical protein